MIDHRQVLVVNKIATNRDFTSDEWKSAGLPESLLRELIDDGYIERSGRGFHPTERGWDMFDDVCDEALEVAEQ